MAPGNFGNGSEPKITAKERRRMEKERINRIRSTKCSIDTKLPHSYKMKGGKIVRTVDRKKRLMEKLQKEYHENENKILERRMKDCNKSLVDHMLEDKYRHFKTINGPARAKYHKWLKLDNNHFRRRLKQTPATYQRKKWQEWRKKTNGAILCNPYTARRRRRQEEIDVDNLVNVNNIVNATATVDLKENNEKYLEQKKLRLVNPYTHARMKVMRDIEFDNDITAGRMKKHIHPTYTPRKWNAERTKLKHTSQTNPYTQKRRKDAEMLAVDNHHLQRRLKDQGPYYVKSKWLAERKEMEKKIVYMCKLNVEHKGWVVAPLIKRKGLQPKRSSSASLHHSPSKPPQYSHAGISPVRPQSIGTSRTGGNKHRRTVEAREISNLIHEKTPGMSEFLLVENFPTANEEAPSSSEVSFNVETPKPNIDNTMIGKADMLQAPIYASSSSINTCSNYEGYKRLAETNYGKNMNGMHVQMFHVG